jgi:hypothetical protein
VDQTHPPELKHELEKRLDDLFDESKPPTEAAMKPSEGNASLRELRAAVLSIDWEINDEILDKLMDEVEALKHTFRNDKILLLFLQLLASVTLYLKENKEKSHPNAVKLLNSIYLKLDSVYSAGGMPQEARKRILLGELGKFKELKARIAAKKAAVRPIPGTGVRAGEAAAPAFPGDRRQGSRGEPPAPTRMDDMNVQEALAVAVEEIKKAIRTEFEALKLELRSK